MNLAEEVMYVLQDSGSQVVFCAQKLLPQLQPVLDDGTLQKVWPTEVESVLYRHPAIQEVCVVGSTDAKRGETVKALIVLNPDHQDTEAEAMIDWARDHCAGFGGIPAAKTG